MRHAQAKASLCTGLFLYTALALCCGKLEPLAYMDMAGVLQHPVPTLSENSSRIPVDKASKEHDLVRVLIFTTVDCPIANGYAPQINKMVTDFADKPVAFFLVHVDPDVTPQIAKSHAKDYSYSLPVILDPEHKLVTFVGATMTPEACVLRNDGKLAYLGRINDWYADLGKKRHNIRSKDLRDAINAVLDGRDVERPRTKTIGCDIPDR